MSDESSPVENGSPSSARSRRSARNDTDSRKGAESRNNSKGPPQLRLHIIKRLKFLLIINIIPLLFAVFFIFSYYQGSIKLVGFSTQTHAWPAAIVLCSCILLGLSWWVVIPCAQWLRDYPRWHYRRLSKVLWALPYACGAVLWGLTWLLCMAAGIIACVAIISSLYTAFIADTDKPIHVQESQASPNPPSGPSTAR